MTFWEAFFSTDKIKYPIMGCVGFSLLMIIVSITLNIKLTDYLIYTFLIVGFLVGNTIKTQKLLE